MAEPKIAIDILVNCQSATSQLKRFNKELNNTIVGGKKATNWLGAGFGKLIGAYFSVRTAQNIFNTGRRIQLVEQSIKGLTKSTQDWEYIQRQAFRTGTDIEVVAKGYRNFFSSARMAGFGGGEIQNMYSDVLLSVRAIGASTQQTEGALLALEQMLSKGKVSMEELRRQLGNAIPGAFEIGAKAMNMTTMEFNDFVKAGKLASSEFVPKFINQLKLEYAGGFKEISETVDFAATNLKNAWKMITREIISGETGRNLAKVISEITAMLRSPAFIGALRTISYIFAQIVAFVGWLIKHADKFLLILAPTAFYGTISGLVGLANAFLTVMKSVMATEIAIAGAQTTLVAFIRTALVAMAWISMLDEAIKGFPTFKRMWTQGVSNSEQEQINNTRELGSIDKNKKELSFIYNNKAYSMPFTKDIENAMKNWQYSTEEVNAWRKAMVETGQAHIITSNKNNNNGGNYSKTNSYNINVSINAPNATGNAEQIGLALGNVLEENLMCKIEDMGYEH